MVIKRGVTVDNNFIGGRNSQATGLNFPENACSDELNCIFNERGFVYRRPSFDFEQNHQANVVTTGNVAITTYLWRNASDDANTNIIVKQIGETLYFYLTNSVLGVSPNILVDTVNLVSFIPSGGTSPALVECQFANGLGKLFVVNSNLTPFAVSYNVTSQAISTSPINIKIRDLQGITDTVASVTQRPVALTDAHKYNLFNQGWDITKANTFNGVAGGYPSNADVWWIFKNATDIYDPATTLTSNTRGNAQAPRGYYVLDAFEQDRATVSGIGTIATVSSNKQMPSAVAFYAGRVFYTGVNASGFADKIYFSQIIEDDNQFGSCYQAADPTSEDVFNLEPTDGGIVRVPGAGQIFKLFNLGNYLVIFAANGVWLLSGNLGYALGFTATDYARTFLSSIRTISATSFVDVQGYPMWWNIDGIQTVKPDKSGQGLTVESLTDKTIKDFYLEIPITNKKFARGAFNTFTHVVQWLYRDDSSSSIEETYEFQKVMNYNILTGAFYFWSIPTSTVKTHSIIVAETGGSSLITENTVIASGGNVIDGLGNQVVTFGLGSSSNIHTTTKFLVSYNTNQVTWAECADFRGDYLDWFTVDGIGIDNSTDVFFVTGFRVHTEGQRRQQVPYLYMFSNGSDDSEFQITSLWDYATNADDARWSNPQTLLNTANNKAYVRNKIRLRGHGVAVQYKVNAVTGQPFNIIGWSTIEDASGGNA